MLSIILFIVVAIVIFWLIVAMSKKMGQFKRHKYDKSDLYNIKNTQDLLPFKDIARNRIDLGEYRYVAIIKVEPYNYMIRSAASKESFAKRLRRAFNSIPFKTQLFTHTRKMTTEKMLSNLEKTIEETVNAHPIMKDYADEYFERMSVINVQNKDTGALRRVKDYYMVVPWEPSAEDNEMDDKALEDHANRGLEEHVETVMSNFAQAGLKSRWLTTVEILSLLIDVYHRDEGNNAEQVFNHSYLSAMVSGDAETLMANKDVDLSSILDGTMDTIESQILENANMPETTRIRGRKVYELEAAIRKKLENKK